MARAPCLAAPPGPVCSPSIDCRPFLTCSLRLNLKPTIYRSLGRFRAAARRRLKNKKREAEGCCQEMIGGGKRCRNRLRLAPPPFGVVIINIYISTTSKEEEGLRGTSPWGIHRPRETLFCRGAAAALFLTAVWLPPHIREAPLHHPTVISWQT